MSTHTPGPWIVRGDNLECTVEKLDGNLRSIITRQHHMAICEEHGGTALANARLIAAAPDLLEVCQAIADLNNGQGQLNMGQVAGWAKQVIAQAQL